MLAAFLFARDDRLGVWPSLPVGEREPDLLTLNAHADEANVSVDDMTCDNVKLPGKLPGAKHTGD